MSSSVEGKDEKFDGAKGGLEPFDLKMFRWARKEYATKLGNGFWSNDLPDLVPLNGAEWDEYTDLVMDVVNDRNPNLAKQLYSDRRDTPFYQKKWHRSWIRKQFDKMYDQVESQCTEAAALEVRALGMERAPELRDHLHKLFGGSGDDVRAREQMYDLGMPKAAGLLAFPVGCDMEERLRTMSGERIALWKMCRPDMRAATSS